MLNSLGSKTMALLKVDSGAARQTLVHNWTGACNSNIWLA